MSGGTAAPAACGANGRRFPRRRLPGEALIGVALLLMIPPGMRAAAEPERARVVVLVNASQPDSLALGVFYAERREIPRANVIALPLPLTETITRDEFVTTLEAPLRERLVAEGWIGAESPDEAAGSHRIAYLVVCRGVPLRVAPDPLRLTDDFKREHPRGLHTNSAAVDGELALLAAPSGMREINGLVPNPLFEVADPDSPRPRAIIRVSRLDGPDYAVCRDLVESALTAERHGLTGRAYVDIGGPHPLGDRWLGSAAERLRAGGFDVVENGAGGLFGPEERFDAAAFYLGWYSPQPYGPLLAPDFRFASGAVALHIHSFSAETVRSATRRWVGPLVARGVAATVGNVYEPQLEYTHRPDLLVQALLAGRTWGEAAYFALPALSWQAVAIGDPLYRPFPR